MGGLYVRNARRKLTRRLLAEDACTSPVSKTLRFSLRKALHVPASDHACARHRPPRSTSYRSRTVAFSCPAMRSILRPRRAAHPLSRSHPTSQTNLTHMSGPASCSSPSGARSVGESNLPSRCCQADCDARAKKFSDRTIVAQVTSPKGLTEVPAHSRILAAGSAYVRFNRGNNSSALSRSTARSCAGVKPV